MSTSGLLTIDCGALARNWLLLQGRLSKKNASCAAVVKANAYGLGVSEVAETLVVAGCKTFFVATLNEAKDLRAIVPSTCRVIVFGGLSHDLTEKGCAQDWRRLGLIPVLFDRADITRWGRFCQQEGRSLPSVLKLDTGMHRLGLSLGDLEWLLDSPDDLLACHPVILMSHFACADDPAHPLNQQQFSLFKSLSEKVRLHAPDIELSLSNSSGIFLSDYWGEDTCFDLARPGSALYGINPLPAQQNPMSAVVRLQLPIMQIKTIQPKEGVGYGVEFIASRVTSLAIVFGGYADGLLRALSQSGFAYLYGQKIPLVGRVSMDSMVFDITDVVIDEQVLSKRPLPYVDIIGEQQSLDDLAAMAGTIGYEMLTSLGSRYTRRYLQVSDVSA